LYTLVDTTPRPATPHAAGTTQRDEMMRRDRPASGLPAPAGRLECARVITPAPAATVTGRLLNQNSDGHLRHLVWCRQAYLQSLGTLDHLAIPRGPGGQAGEESMGVQPDSLARDQPVLGEAGCVLRGSVLLSAWPCLVKRSWPLLPSSSRQWAKGL